MADNEGLIKQFREITGVDEERAKFYLEAANWELQSAMAGFYEGEEGEVDMPSVQPAAAAPPPISSSKPEPVAAAPKTKSAPQPSSGRVMTFSSLQNDEDSGSDSDPDDRNRQSFYAGGSDSSGQQVLGPRRDNADIGEMLLRRARELGAEEMLPKPPTAGGKKQAFSGAGYKLGDEVSSASASDTASSTPGAAGATPAVTEITLSLFSNGFTLSNDPTNLRTYTDPNNAPFLAAIHRGEVPLELRRSVGMVDCTLNIMDKRGEAFAAPKKPVAFTGTGQTLGSPAPNVVVPSAGNKEDNEKQARESVQIQDTRTSVQFRLVDGSRIANVGFGVGNRIGELYEFLNRARPEYAELNYVLTMFPNILLEEKEKRLDEAGVANAVVVMKMK